MDGDKFICLDNFDKMANKVKRQIQSYNRILVLSFFQDCYIYTFGISNDWTFEDIMDKVGG